MYVCVYVHVWLPVKLWRVVQLCPVWQATCPCKDWCNRVGRCRLAFLVLPENMEVKVYTLVTYIYVLLIYYYIAHFIHAHPWTCTGTWQQWCWYCKASSRQNLSASHIIPVKSCWEMAKRLKVIEKTYMMIIMIELVRPAYQRWVWMQQEWINWFWVLGEVPGMLLILQ